jgi:tripartite-type tricarboxylate transporter receptor subunit TctC
MAPDSQRRGTSRVAKATPDGYQCVLGSLVTTPRASHSKKSRSPTLRLIFRPLCWSPTSRSCWLRARILRPTMWDSSLPMRRPTRRSCNTARPEQADQIICLLLNTVIGINVIHVPYRSGAQAMQDLLAGRIDYQCPTGAVAVPQIAANTVKALAVLSKNFAHQFSRRYRLPTSKN